MGLKLRTLQWKIDKTFSRANEEHWGSWIYAHLDPEWKSMLDLGGGTGSETVKFADGKRLIVCIDLSKKQIERGRRIYGRVPNFHHVIGDACSLPFKNNTFDVVHCWAALHHFPDRRRSLAEVHRVLNPGGKMLMLEPGLLNPLAASARTLFPTPSHEPGEKPFVPSMLEKLVCENFINVEVRHFSTLTYILPFLLARFRGLSGAMKPVMPYLIRLDDRLSRMFKEFAGVIAVKAEKPH